MRKIRISRKGAALCLFMSLLGLFMTSCEDDNVGEYKLTGNIESLIPDYSYSISTTVTSGSNGTSYLVVTPKIDDNFEYWGLIVKRVDYYIDDVLFETITTSPYELVTSTTNISYGNHTVTAKITVCGEYCDDVALEKSDDFTVSSSGTVSSPSASIYVDYNYVCKGETLHVAPEILEEHSPEGSKITKVEYYWDDKLVESKTASPFTWDYVVNDDAGTSHSIRAYIRYSYGSNSTGSLNWSFGSYTIMEDDECRKWWTRKEADNKNEYRNGETVQSVAKCYKGKNCTDTYSFKLYYDDKQIAESSTFPYEIDYKLENQSAGSHTFKAEWTVKQADGGSHSSSTYETIIVIP